MKVLRRAFAREPLGMFAAVTSLVTAVATVAPMLSKDDFTVISECSPVTPESRVVGGRGGLAGSGSLYIEGDCLLINAERFDIGIIEILTTPVLDSNKENRRTINAEFFGDPPILKALSATKVRVIFEVSHSARFSWLAVGIGKYASSISVSEPVKLNDVYASVFKSDIRCYREDMPVVQAINEVFEGDPEYSSVNIHLANSQRIEIHPHFEGSFGSLGLPLVGTPVCPELSEDYFDVK